MRKSRGEEKAKKRGDSPASSARCVGQLFGNRNNDFCIFALLVYDLFFDTRLANSMEVAHLLLDGDIF
jgi:hypothetical protein